jgi:hypothetical protein
MGWEEGPQVFINYSLSSWSGKLFSGITLGHVSLGAPSTHWPKSFSHKNGNVKPLQRLTPADCGTWISLELPFPTSKDNKQTLPMKIKKGTVHYSDTYLRKE